MKRGDIVIADGPGDFSSKRRPFLVVQSDAFNQAHGSISLCPITSELSGNTLFRVALPATDATGLEDASEAQIDKVQSLRRHRIRETVGAASPSSMVLVDACLRRWFDL